MVMCSPLLLIALLFLPVGLKEISVNGLVGGKERKHDKPDPAMGEERVYQSGGIACMRAKLRPSESHQVNDQMRNGCDSTVTQYRNNVDLILLF